MQELFFFDADCRIGSGPLIGVRPDAAELIAEMDYFGIDKALVRHGNFAMLGAPGGNRDLVRLMEADEARRLYGVWCVLPSQCRELPEPEQLFREMKELRISALTLMPDDHLFVACRLTVGKLMDAAAERRVPVFMEAVGNDWRNLYAFIAEFPRNRFIIADRYGKWGHDRQIRPLLENYESVYFCTTGYWVPEGIRDLTALYGPERILYGSGFPRYDQGSGMLQLKHSGLAEAEIAKIAGKNLEKLLSEAQL